MSFYIKKVILPILIFTLIFILVLYLVKKNPKTETTKTNYTLKSYKNTVALYSNDELLTVYTNIVLNTLPQNDIEHFEKGITFSTPAQAEAYLEDFE